MKNLEALYSAYDSSDYSSESSEIRFEKLFSLIQNPNDMRILDYGCGPGNLIDWMKSRHISPKDYFGYDVRKKTVEYARIRFPLFKFDTCLPSKDFDVAILCGTISYAYDKDIQLCKSEYLKEIQKAISLVSPNGIVCGTARKSGYEQAKNKSSNLMITYRKEELFEIGVTDVYDFLEKEWLFRIVT
jgi:SAM-dependent methyltransferase